MPRCRAVNYERGEMCTRKRNPKIGKLQGLKMRNLQGRPFIVRFAGRGTAYLQGTLYMPDAFFSISSLRALYSCD